MQELLAKCKQFNEENPGYDYFGLRADDRVFEIGEELPVSYVWDDGEKTDESLDGTCAVSFCDCWNDVINEKALAQIKDYLFDNVYLIAAKSCQEGNDNGEWVMYEAVVIDIIKD